MLWGFLSNHVNVNLWTTQIENILTLAYCGHLNFHEPKLGKTRHVCVCVCVCVGAGVHTCVYRKNFSHYLSSIFIDYNMIVLYCWESLWLFLIWMEYKVLQSYTITNALCVSYSQSYTITNALCVSYSYTITNTLYVSQSQSYTITNTLMC
jgi:hypothetical protein